MNCMTKIYGLHSFGPDEKEKCDPYTALMPCLLIELNTNMVSNKMWSEISIPAFDSHSPVEVSVSFVWIRQYNRRVEAHIGNKYCVVNHSSIRFVNSSRSHNWHNMCILNREHLHNTVDLIRIYFICNIFGRCSSSNTSCCC